MRLAIAIAVLTSACEPPEPGLDLQLSSGPSQECPSTDCNDIAMTCRMFMSVRILDPDDPTAPLHSECLEIPMTNSETLCPIGGLELQPHTLPYRDLEVQVAVYPESVVDPPTMTDPFFRCPTGTTYDHVNGFPISVPDQVTPALGGRGYYRPGDDTIRVTLGCSNLDELDKCQGIASVIVTATVDDFDTRLSVDVTQARGLSVSVGQPKPANMGFALNNSDLTELVDTIAAAPAWSGTVNELFTAFACLTVLDDTPQSTTTVTCKRAKVTDTMIDLAGADAGARLTKASLDQILAALSLTQFPLQGMTIGVVVDNGIPVANQVVTASEGTVEYLSSDRTTVGGSMTSGGANGAVFVSRDAPFGTTFRTTRTTLPNVTVSKLGGRIVGKATIVVLDLANGGTEPD